MLTVDHRAGRTYGLVLVLPCNTFVESVMQTTITSKGQVTIPRDIRRHFGLTPGMSVSFFVEGDHIALRPAPAARQPSVSGFGLIRSALPGAPADLDMAGFSVEAP